LTRDLLILALGIATAFLVGTTSIGGVFVVPTLHLGFGISVHAAIAATMIAFLPSASVTLLVALARRSLHLRMCRDIWLGAVPGALLGALALPSFSGDVLLAGVAVMLIASGLRAVFDRSATPQEDQELGSAELLAAGGVTGLVSALTGTGGPIILMPILAWRGVAPLTAVTLCQAAVIPISIFASLGYARSGVVDWRLAALLAASYTVGIVIGVRAAHRMPARHLRRIIGVVMTAAGIVIAIRMIFG
jgi:uncharacterized membrane protein YfcA